MKAKQPRPIDRSIPGQLRDTTLFIIATEGEASGPEYQYFSDPYFQSRRTQIRLLPTNNIDHDSSPQQVVRRLRKFRETIDLNAGDHLYAIIDKDRWPEGPLAELIQAAKKGKPAISVLVSNECFEVWLLLHLTERLTSAQPTKRKQELKQLCGEHKVSLKDLVQDKYISAAIVRAEALDSGTSSTARWPEAPGTWVYKLVKEITP